MSSSMIWIGMDVHSSKLPSGPLQLDMSPFISLLQQRLEARVVAP